MGYYLPGPAGVISPGVAPDGLKGQFLAKASDIDYDTEWVDVTIPSAGDGGSVTSVSLAVPTGFSVSGSPVIGSGTLSLTFAAGYSLPTIVRQSGWDAAAVLAGTAVQPAALTSALMSKADLINNVIPTSQIPSIAVVQYLGQVATEAAMLALRGEGGDWCIRTDSFTQWVIIANNGAAFSDWIQLPNGISPVSSINGQTGAVTLGTGDLQETGSNLFFTAARAIGSALQGFVAGAGAVSATDSILQAINKIVGNIAEISARPRGSNNQWIPAAQWIPATTNGCGINSLETSVNRINYDVLEFDPITSEQADCVVILPNNWSFGTISARFYWTAASGSGGVVFQLAGLAYGDNVALDTAIGTPQSVADTLLTANNMHVSSATAAITIAGTPAANKPVQFQVRRLPADPSDTLAVDARLIGVEILF